MEQTFEVATRFRRSKQQIQDLLNVFEKSNLSVKDFCKEHSIHPANFHKWKTRYKPKSARKKNSSGFATLDIVSSPRIDLPGLFAEVKGIKIYQPVSASFLKELL